MALGAGKLQLTVVTVLGLVAAGSFVVKRMNRAPAPSPAAIRSADPAAQPNPAATPAIGGVPQAPDKEEVAHLPPDQARETPVPDFMNKLPESFRQTMMEAKRRRENALSSEAGARAELKNLRDCVTKGGGAPAPTVPAEMQSRMPPELKARMAQMPLLIQADCVLEARRLATKFPALRPIVDREIMAVAPPKAVQMARPAK